MAACSLLCKFSLKFCHASGKFTLCTDYLLLFAWQVINATTLLSALLSYCVTECEKLKKERSESNKWGQCVSIRTEIEAERLLEAPCRPRQVCELKTRSCCRGRRRTVAETAGRKILTAVWRQTMDTHYFFLSRISMHRWRYLIMCWPLYVKLNFLTGYSSFLLPPCCFPVIGWFSQRGNERTTESAILPSLRFFLYIHFLSHYLSFDIFWFLFSYSFPLYIYLIIFTVRGQKSIKTCWPIAPCTWVGSKYDREVSYAHKQQWWKIRHNKSQEC